MENKKQKAIREAWGEHYDFVKVNLNKDGSFYVYDYQTDLYEWCVKNTKCIGMFESGSTFVPFSLIGIKTNNGWISIESEADLPPDGHYWTIDKKGEMHDTPRVNEFHNDDSFWLRNFTHYQPIIKPSKPIY